MDPCLLGWVIIPDVEKRNAQTLVGQYCVLEI
jgi:hypothetical protein